MHKYTYSIVHRTVDNKLCVPKFMAANKTNFQSLSTTKQFPILGLFAISNEIISIQIVVKEIGEKAEICIEFAAHTYIHIHTNTGL